MKTNEFTVKCALGACTLLGALALTTGPITAATSYIGKGAAGDSAAIRPETRVETAILADDKPGTFARSRAIRTALGMPVGDQTRGAHVKDGSRRIEYDEITDVDSKGSPVSMTEVDGSGQLLMAVRFDLPGGSKMGLDRAGALKKATDGLAAAGVTTVDQPIIDATTSIGGWDVRWNRTKDGVAVRGDEIRVHVRDDGQIASVGQAIHELAPVPSIRLTRDQARKAAGRQVQTWTSRSGAQFSIGNVELQWAGPNAAFDSTLMNAPEQPFRLSWVVSVTPLGNAASAARLVVLYVDAGDGSVIGGDVVE